MIKQTGRCTSALLCPLEATKMIENSYWFVEHWIWWSNECLFMKRKDFGTVNMGFSKEFFAIVLSGAKKRQLLVYCFESLNLIQQYYDVMMEGEAKWRTFSSKQLKNVKIKQIVLFSLPISSALIHLWSLTKRNFLDKHLFAKLTANRMFPIHMLSLAQ